MIAFLFPGQGSQYIGMGKDIWEKSQKVKEIFTLASDICNIDLVKLCFEGPIEELTKTINLQPALTSVEISIFSCLLEKNILPEAVAGHSLGEYPALYAAGVLSLEDTFKAVKERAHLMEEAAKKHPGSMLAIVKLDLETVKNILIEYKEAELANYNSPQQIVISGNPEILTKISQRIKDLGGRGIPLKVSGAWHSSFIKEAQERFKEFLENISFKTPKIKIYFNVTAKTETDPEKIKEIMWKQLCSPVLWCEEIKNIYKDGIDTFVEVGPKQVLAGLLKYILPKDSYKVFTVENISDIQKLSKDWEEK